MSLLDQNSNQYKNHSIARLREKFYIALWASNTSRRTTPKELFMQANDEAIMFFKMERELLDVRKD